MMKYIESVSLLEEEMEGIGCLVEDSELLKTPDNRRTFEYNLNDKAAKAKLLKGARREPFEVVVNQTSCNLVFSVGGWKQVVQPTIEYLNQIKGLKTCKVGSIEVKVVSVKTGKDVVGKHIDHQITFFSSKEKVVCHFYNTTQLILVNGHGYVKFIEHFLRPYFEHKLPIHEKDIEEYNNLVIETLGSRTVKRSDVKYKAGFSFPCLKCDFSGKSVASLDKHKKNRHAISFVSATTSPSTSLVIPRHSTRNNSILEENNSSTDISKDVIDQVLLDLETHVDTIDPPLA